MPRIKTTFTLYTPESIEQGDAAEHGWIDEEGQEIEADPEFDETVVGEAVRFLRDVGIVEASSSHFHKGVWYSGGDSDFDTGEIEQRSYHLYDFTVEQEQEIFNLMTRR